MTQPHLVSWWPAYLGSQQEKSPPGILKYTAREPGLGPANHEVGQQPGREEGPGAELQAQAS